MEHRTWSIEHGFYPASVANLAPSTKRSIIHNGDFESSFGTSATEVIHVSMFYVPLAEGGPCSINEAINHPQW
jgi:hypothetical protein